MSTSAKAAAIAPEFRTASAVVPLETPTDKKRSIDQSACNQDLSCLRDSVPQLTVEGARLRRGRALDMDHAPAAHGRPIPQHGATLQSAGHRSRRDGVITLAPCRHGCPSDGKGVSVLDMTGLAQKYGAVFSTCASPTGRGHPRPRIATGEAHAILGATSS